MHFLFFSHGQQQGSGDQTSGCFIFVQKRSCILVFLGITEKSAAFFKILRRKCLQSVIRNHVPQDIFAGQFESVFNGVQQFLVAPVSTDMLIVRVLGDALLSGPVEVITPSGSALSPTNLTFVP